MVSPVAVRVRDRVGLGIILNFTPVSINAFSLTNNAPRKASNACRDAPRRHIVSFRGSDHKAPNAFLGVRPRWSGWGSAHFADDSLCRYVEVG